MHAIYITGSEFSFGNPFSAAHSISKDSTLNGAKSDISSNGMALKF